MNDAGKRKQTMPGTQNVNKIADTDPFLESPERLMTMLGVPQELLNALKELSIEELIRAGSSMYNEIEIHCRKLLGRKFHDIYDTALYDTAFTPEVLREIERYLEMEHNKPDRTGGEHEEDLPRNATVFSSDSF